VLALMATIGNLGGYVAPCAVGLAKEATGRTDFGLYLMAAAMVLGALLVQLLPRNATIDEAGHGVVLKEGAAVGAS
jgi:nitrate/nitrite transporter NarK